MSLKDWWIPLFMLCVSVPCFAEEAGSEEVCFYTDVKGMFRSSEGRANVPEKYRSSATCNAKRKVSPKSNSNYNSYGRSTHSPTGRVAPIRSSNRSGGGDQRSARPNEVKLDGVRRRIDLSTGLGPVALQWQTEVEDLFGRSPRQSVKSAWLAAQHALAKNSFPTWLRSATYEWNMVFMDDSATDRTRYFGQGKCHPGWIRPPADIFISATLIATSCGRGKRTPSDALRSLNGTLLHELGHAVEYQLLGRAAGRREKYHSEGFAMWFETLAGQYMFGDNKYFSKSGKRKEAKTVFSKNWDPRTFNSSHDDYVRAYAMIATIAEMRSVRRLSKIYELVRERGLTFDGAVKEELGWDMQTWKKKVEQHLKK